MPFRGASKTGIDVGSSGDSTGLGADFFVPFFFDYTILDPAGLLRYGSVSATLVDYRVVCMNYLYIRGVLTACGAAPVLRVEEGFCVEVATGPVILPILRVSHWPGESGDVSH